MACNEPCEERLRLALEATDLAVWDFDPIAGTVDGTSRLKALWGLKPHELLTYAGWLERLHPEDRQLAVDTVQRSLDPAGSGLQEMHYRIVQPDGSVRWLAIRGRTHFAEVEGRRRAVRVVGTMLDITEQKRADESLQLANKHAEESLVRLQAVMESMTDALIIADLAGDLIYHNPASMALHGYCSREEACRPADRLACLWEIRDLQGRLLSPQEWPIARALRGERFGNCERIVRRPDTGKEFIGSYNGTPVHDRDGQMILAIVTIRDITEIKRAEEQLKTLNETLEQRVAERTAVAEDRADQLRILASQLTGAEERERQRVAHILHEHFQQLLVGAKFDVSLLRSQLCGRPDCKGPPILARINQVLDRSIAESRTLSVELSPPVLHAMGLAETLHWLGRWMQDKHGLQVDVTADKTAEPQAEDIRILLFHAVRELLFNVVKHAHAKQAHVQMGICDEHIQVVVSDDGVGLAQDELRIKADASSGFGLFGLRERLELLGGQLRIDGCPGQGTRVSLRVPRSMPHAAQPPCHTDQMPPAVRQPDVVPGTPACPEKGAAKIRILLADDHIVVRDGLARLLQMQPDFQVVGQAADGRQAVDLALQLRPDVVLMDVSMPNLGGVEATRCIVSQVPQVRVIGLSMHSDEGVAAAMAEAGAVGYVRKTAAPESLVAAVRLHQPLRS